MIPGSCVVLGGRAALSDNRTFALFSLVGILNREKVSFRTQYPVTIPKKSGYVFHVGTTTVENVPGSAHPSDVFTREC